ncbi:MAG: hypothetical protein GY779_11195 [Gammaproteobacteria bacterium]|nr:hypothetical protein [Gammaproteobacteria bacterium]
MERSNSNYPEWFKFILFISLIFLSACDGGGGNDDDSPITEGGDLSSAARTAVLAANDIDCPYGGILVETGIDENGNGLLDDGEVDSAEKVCNGAAGADGNTALVSVSDEPAGANCIVDGLRIDAGLDLDNDGLLDISEITATEYMCGIIGGNEAPQFTSGSDFSVQENNAAVATISATDPQSDNVIFTILNSYDGADFTIDGASGELSFITIPDYESPFDGDQDNVYQVQVGATDGAYLATQLVTVTVNDVLELNVVNPEDTSYVNRVWFDWSDYEGTVYYKLFVNPDGASGYTQLLTNFYDFGAENFSSWDEVSVHLADWVNASYMVEAYGAGGVLLASSAPESIVPVMIDAIGYLKAINTQAGDGFSSVALSGDGRTLAVGAPGEDSDQAPNFNVEESAGAVYIFKRGSTWIPRGYVKANNAGAEDQFGLKVALSYDGNILAVGAPYEDSNGVGVDDYPNNGDDFAYLNSGAAYVFEYSAGNWYQQAYVKASNTDPDEWLGYSIALSNDGTILAVGAPKEDSASTGTNGNQADNTATSAGAVYLFNYNGSTWSQQAYIKASNTDAGDWFGGSIDLSDNANTLVVGAASEDSIATGIDGNQSDDTASGAGAVYLFYYSGSSWNQQTYFKASNTEASDGFGGNLAISGDGKTLGVGSKEASNATGIDGDQTNNLAIYSGAVYLFIDTDAGWEQQAYIKASNTDERDYFGGSIALSSDGNILAVGADQEDSDAIGLDGNQDNTGSQTGAAYVFTRSGITWSQQAYIKASNTGSYDYFGISVTLSDDGEKLAVGARRESSDSIGVNGDQSNDSAESAGAVYLY